MLRHKSGHLKTAVLAALLVTASCVPARAADDAEVAAMAKRIDALEAELADLKIEQKKLAARQKTEEPQAVQPDAEQPKAAWQAAVINPPAAVSPGVNADAGSNTNDAIADNEAPAPAVTADSTPAKPADPDAVTVKLDKNGLAVKNAQNDTLMRVHGFIQADDRFFLADHDKNGNDSFELRRARLIIEGGAHGFFYNLTPDFGGGSTQLMDAYAGYNYKDVAGAQIGKMKPPLGLEELRGNPDLTFAEFGTPSLLVPVRDAGAEVFGVINNDYFESKLTWQLGVFNGTPDNSNGNADQDDGKQGVARVFAEPFDGVGLGVAGSYGRTNGNATTSQLPAYTTSGRVTFFSYAKNSLADGQNWRVMPQTSVYEGPFSLLAEYVISAQDVRNGATQADLENKAWGAQATWVMTGEDATYKSVSPAHPFDPAHDEWGAWELGGRYGKIDIDSKAFPVLASPSASASSATNWGVVLNGYLTDNARLLLDYERTSFDGGKAGGQDRETENALISRAQYQF